MRIAVEVSSTDLAEMALTNEQLQVAVKRQVESGLDVDGDTIYLSNVQVCVLVTSGAGSGQ